MRNDLLEIIVLQHTKLQNAKHTTGQLNCMGVKPNKMKSAEKRGRGATKRYMLYRGGIPTQGSQH